MTKWIRIFRKNFSNKMEKLFFKKNYPQFERDESSDMLDMIKVDVYGQQMPINQLATINVPEALISVWLG